MLTGHGYSKLALPRIAAENIEFAFHKGISFYTFSQSVDNKEAILLYSHKDLKNLPREFVLFNGQHIKAFLRIKPRLNHLIGLKMDKDVPSARSSFSDVH